MWKWWRLFIERKRRRTIKFGWQKIFFWQCLWILFYSIFLINKISFNRKVTDLIKKNLYGKEDSSCRLTIWMYKMTDEFPFLDTHWNLFFFFSLYLFKKKISELKKWRALYLPLKARLSKANSCFAFSGSSSGTSLVSIKRRKEKL